MATHDCVTDRAAVLSLIVVASSPIGPDIDPRRSAGVQWGRTVLSFAPPSGRGGPQFIPRPDSARLGDPPPWAGHADPSRLANLGVVVETVQRSRPYDPEVVAVDGKPPSAVLVPLVDGPDGVELVLTRRSWKLRSHTGEVSFPGGRKDPEDRSLVVTALRETEEEIGLDRKHVEVIGQLDPLVTVSSPSMIVPYVGTIASLPALTPSPDEVDGILHVSLAELLDPSIYREEIWARDGFEMPITFFELDGDTLWGATARMVRNLLELLVDVEPTGRGYG